MKRLLQAMVLVATVGLALTASEAAPGREPRGGADAATRHLKRYEGRYYIIFTDLEGDAVREADLRMSRMAEEYYERTKGFAGRIERKFPFYLFRKPEDYYAAGGVPGSAGVFMVNAGGAKLMAIAGEDDGAPWRWHVVQHEGFHQFAHSVIRGDLPAWVNEGLAEYFGVGIFTGDGFITGVIPPDRLERIRQSLEQNRFRSVPAMMRLSYQAWNAGLSSLNYDQAWAMVHFLAHAEDGRYQKPFIQYMNALSRRTPPERAWQESFGDAAGFEERWRKWWLELPENPTADRYTQAIVATLSSFMARAAAQKQAFVSFEDFAKVASDGALKIGRDAWLPPALLEQSLKAAAAAKGEWSLELAESRRPRPPRTSAGRKQESSGAEANAMAAERTPAIPKRLIYQAEDGTRVIGRYTLRGSSVGKITVTVDDTAKVLARARDLIHSGRKSDARSILRAALRAHPDSPFADEARKLSLEAK